MALFNLFNKKEVKTNEVTVLDNSTSSFGSTKSKDEFAFQPDFNPLLKLNGVFVNGTLNLYPQYLNDLYKYSPLLSEIIKFKRNLTVSNGYDIINPPINTNDKLTLNQLTSQFDELLNDIGLDYWLASKFYVEVTFNSAHTKIIKLEYVPSEKIRVAQVDEKFKPTLYEYCYDWVVPTKFGKKCYVPFNTRDKRNHVQLDCFELRSPGQIIYNRPAWESAINWAELDKESSVYHASNINNSINPSAMVEFFQKPANEETETKILDKLNKDFAGAKKAGRLMVFFNKSIETAAKLTMLDAQKLDKTFITLGDTIQRQICFALGIDPAIMGLRVSSQLGQGVNLKESFTLFNFNEILPAQRNIENKVFNKYLSFNGLTSKVKFKSAQELYSEMTQSKTQVNNNITLSDIKLMLDDIIDNTPKQTSKKQ